MPQSEQKTTPLDWLIIVVLLALIVGALFGPLLIGRAKAHDAGGWMYPKECCSEGDCAIATAVKYNDDGSWEITTKHGTATYPSTFPRKSSPDGKIHACHIGQTKYCLFVPAGA